jgi:SAM-dependent methyltransferase
VRPCPVCARESSTPAFEAGPLRLAHGGLALDAAYAYRACGRCRATFLAKLPPREHLAIYYESPAYHVAPAGTKLKLARRWQFALGRPLPNGAPGRHLDFGCGPGAYLTFSRARGWDGTGVEWNEDTSRAARDAGHHIVLAAEIESLEDHSFDFVSALHALEHVENPRAIFESLARKLRPGGTLFVEVPFLGLEFRLFGRHYSMIQAPLHLVFFADETMSFLAEVCGLVLLSARNNLFTPVPWVWSALNLLGAAGGPELAMRTKITLSAAAFPLTLPATAVASALGARTTARQYRFRCR